MSKCVECRFFGKEFEDTGYHVCDAVEHFDAFSGKKMVDSAAHVVDESGYYAALVVSDDFCCCLFEAK